MTENDEKKLENIAKKICQESGVAYRDVRFNRDVLTP